MEGISLSETQGETRGTSATKVGIEVIRHRWSGENSVECQRLQRLQRLRFMMFVYEKRSSPQEAELNYIRLAS